MHKKDPSNILFQLAADLVNHTAKHVFLTGKAGTGKTTFLKYIREHTQKHTVVVAPTGVAAINAGGVTMHSFFQLPFGPFLPVAGGERKDGMVTDKQSLFRNIRFGAAKRELFEELELLIIDEVSMVRCDMLDAVDTILRHFRREPLLPFGGVQVVYIGDLFQLPPVIPPHEWEVLQPYYESPFFFKSKVVEESPPLYIELKKIYRQNEQAFIDILNRIRNNVVERNDLTVLNNRFDPSFQPREGESFITLTTHNRKADIINEAALEKLTAPLHAFPAEISGEFSDKSFPTERELRLRVGAQVMFVKNDSGNERRYFNGKLGRVKSISGDGIVVSFGNGEEDLTLEKETWKNLRYQYNGEEDRFEEEEIGKFVQYPVRLAWAITIHKSQGLSFEKAVIDAGSSFAAGQVYVALSRCTSLEGLVLHSRIGSQAISTDPRVIAFAREEASDALLESVLRQEKEKFQAGVLVNAFQWGKLVKAVREWRTILEGKKIPDKEAALRLQQESLSSVLELEEVAAKFQHQLKQILASGDRELLFQRVNKAILYLAAALKERVLAPMQAHRASLQRGSKVKKYLKELGAIESVVLLQLQKLNKLEYGPLVFVQYVYESGGYPLLEKAVKKERPVKGASQLETLSLFREGKPIAEIAALRQLSSGTVEGHLASFIGTGEVRIEELVAGDKIRRIADCLNSRDLTAQELKQELGPDFSYGEIRAVMNEVQRKRVLP